MLAVSYVDIMQAPAITNPYRIGRALSRGLSWLGVHFIVAGATTLMLVSWCGVYGMYFIVVGFMFQPYKTLTNPMETQWALAKRDNIFEVLTATTAISYHSLLPTDYTNHAQLTTY